MYIMAASTAACKLTSSILQNIYCLIEIKFYSRQLYLLMVLSAFYERNEPLAACCTTERRERRNQNDEQESANEGEKEADEKGKGAGKRVKRRAKCRKRAKK